MQLTFTLGTMMTEIVAIAGIVGTVLGALFGALGAYFAGKHQADAVRDAARQQVDVQRELMQRQLDATLILSNRQAWIDALRDDVTELSAFLLTLIYSLQQQSPEGQAVWADQVAKASMLESRIHLRLDQDQETHAELLQHVQDAVGGVRNGNASSDWRGMSHRILEATRLVVEEELRLIRAQAAGHKFAIR